MSRLEEAAAKIDAAEKQVAAAQDAYSRGGSATVVNRANAALANAWASYREVSGGNLPDRR
jgi:hypothetical protein